MQKSSSIFLQRDRNTDSSQKFGMGPLDAGEMIQVPALSRRPSERSEESATSRRTDEEKSDSLLPPKRRAYSSDALTHDATRSHVEESSWTCKSCSYQNSDPTTIACAVCGINRHPQRQWQRRGIVVASYDSFASSYASGIVSLDASGASELDSLNKSTTEAEGSVSALGSRPSSDSDSQGSVATIRVSNRTEDHFWRTRRSGPSPVAEEGDELSRSSTVASSGSRMKLRNEGSCGGFQPPTPRSAQQTAQNLKPRPQHRSSAEGDSGRCTPSNGGLKPHHSSVRNSNSLHDGEISFTAPEQQGNNGGFYRAPLLLTRHGSVGEEPQLMTSGRESDPDHTLSRPGSFVSGITFSPSPAEGAYSNDTKGGFLAFPIIDPLAQSHQNSDASLNEGSLNRGSLNRGGTRSIPTGDPDADPSTSEMSTFADENSILSTNKSFLTRRNILTMIAIICSLAVAVSVGATILFVKKHKFAIQSHAENDEIRTIFPLSTPPSGSPSIFESSQPTNPPTSPPTAPISPPTAPISPHPIGQVVTGRVAEEEFGDWVQLAANGTVMAVSSRSGIVHVYQLTEKGGWAVKWRGEGDGSGQHPVVLSKDGNVIAEYLNGRIKTYELAENDLPQKRGDPINIGRQVVAGSSLSLSSDGSVLAIASADDGSGREGLVSIYSYNSTAGAPSSWISMGEPLIGYSSFSGFDIDLSGDGTRLAVASWKESVDPVTSDSLITSRQVRTYQFDMQSWEAYGPHVELRNPEPPDQSLASVSLSSDGSLLAACTTLACFAFSLDTLRNYSTSYSWRRIGDNLDGGNDVSLSDNGKTLIIGMASTGVGGAIRVYDIKSPIILSRFEIEADDPGNRFGQAVSVSGQAFAIGSPMDDAAAQDAGSVQVYSLS